MPRPAVPSVPSRSQCPPLPGASLLSTESTAAGGGCVSVTDRCMAFQGVLGLLNPLPSCLRSLTAVKLHPGVPPKCEHTLTADSAILEMKSMLINTAFMIIQCVCTFGAPYIYAPCIWYGGARPASGLVTLRREISKVWCLRHLQRGPRSAYDR